MSREETFAFKVLIKHESNEWIAHCLELDLVATADTLDQVQQDIIDVIDAQVRYALENDNLDHLYRAAPHEVWNEYFACEKCEERGHTRLTGTDGTDPVGRIRPLIVTDTCLSENSGYA